MDDLLDSVGEQVEAEGTNPQHKPEDTDHQDGSDPEHVAPGDGDALPAEGNY